MKQYKSIEETIADVRKKDKKYNYIILIVVLLMISVIASLIIYAQDKKNKANKTRIEFLADENEVNQELIEKYQFEFIENERLRRNDSLRTDSIATLVKTLRKELAHIERDLNNKNIPRTDRATALTSVNLAQDKLNRITNNITDNTIVRYYKRKADGSRIEHLIQGMKNPSFNLNLMQVVNDNGRNRVNTIWYGADVNKDEVFQLVDHLLKIRVHIKNVKEFDNPSTKGWKSQAIEIGYENVATTTKVVTQSDLLKYKSVNTNDKYNVRFYSFNPDEKAKRSLASFIKKYNYNLKIYPDWKKKPSFFSNSPTIFYYSDKSKIAARELRDKLNKTGLGVKFTTQRGSGYGISKSELDNTFIVHYME
ncbi:hypothetical protein IMCC3317_00190 [Kordia antarctica]|uniref:Uncharacterized protein n=1 Tax=Kordia antarctica TaxID=1218801 RepID=A0A7L4ZEM0_9FLAO|nr:hypothetical protein [Kordia antarctica]QHI34676.1 hypothetical protein IMCC3317_00190 [Kordia antarctica]